jgi:aminoglycoside phosphotransferase (APT) family kinase protein
VTIDGQAVERALQVSWPAARLIEPPTPITGGEWATMYRLAVAGVPDGVPSDLVLRIVPHEEMGAKELAVQRAAAALGVRTPPVRLRGPAGVLGGAWGLMDFVPGSPLLAGLDGAAAVRGLPRIARHLPVQLAETMAEVHRLDPDPVVTAVRRAAPSVALTVDEVWPHLRLAADGLGDVQLASALDALWTTRPAPTPEVVCHGDLHPFNLLVEGDQITVLDWTAALVAPPAFDVALTWLLLRFPPLAAPKPLTPVIGTAGRYLAGRFVRSYRAANPGADLTSLSWYRALHASRVLIDLAAWQEDGDPRAESHPWRLVAPGARSVLARTTGVGVRQSVGV